MDVFPGKTFLALVCAFICFWTKVDSTCDGSNPPTLNTVTFDMIPGRWFKQSGMVVFPNDGIPLGQFLTHFTLDFQPYGKLDFNARTTFEPQECIYNTLDTKSNMKPSTFEAFIGYLNKYVEIRIIDTDFEKYLLWWVCLQFDKYNPNKCTDWMVDLLTRRVDGYLTKNAIRSIELGLNQTICRTRDLILTTPDPKRNNYKLFAVMYNLVNRHDNDCFHGD